MRHEGKKKLLEIKKEAGFSLVEMLVAIAVFIILVSILAGIYVAFSRNQTRANIQQKMVNSLQYTLEVMSRQIRDNGIVDFSGTCPVLGYTEGCILLEREDGSFFAFAQNSDTLEYVLVGQEDSGVYSVISDPASSVQLLSPEINNMRIDLLNFYIRPSADPYLQGGPNQQPKVTIVLRASYSGSGNITATYNMQTTVSSRIYRR